MAKKSMSLELGVALYTMEAMFTVDKHSDIFSFIHSSLAHVFTDSFQKHLGSGCYMSDNIITKYQPPDHQNVSVTDSDLNDSMGSAQAGF